MTDKEYINSFCQLLKIENAKDGAIPVFVFFMPRSAGAKPRLHSISGLPMQEIKRLLTSALLSLDEMTEVIGIPLESNEQTDAPFLEKYARPYEEELPL